MWLSIIHAFWQKWHSAKRKLEFLSESCQEGAWQKTSPICLSIDMGVSTDIDWTFIFGWTVPWRRGSDIWVFLKQQDLHESKEDLNSAAVWTLTFRARNRTLEHISLTHTHKQTATHAHTHTHTPHNQDVVTWQHHFKVNRCYKKVLCRGGFSARQTHCYAVKALLSDWRRVFC